MVLTGINPSLLRSDIFPISRTTIIPILKENTVCIYIYIFTVYIYTVVCVSVSMCTILYCRFYFISGFLFETRRMELIVRLGS